MGMTVRRRLSRGRDGTFVDGKIRGRGKTNSVLLRREEFGSATHRVARAAVAMAFAGSRMARRACLRETARASPRARVCDPGARSSPSRFGCWRSRPNRSTTSSEPSSPGGKQFAGQPRATKIFGWDV